MEAGLAGLNVVGLDRASATVDRLNSGVSHVDDVSDTAVAELRARGFTATTDERVLADTDTVVICVPTRCPSTAGPT